MDIEPTRKDTAIVIKNPDHRHIDRLWMLLSTPMLAFILLPILALVLRSSPNQFFTSLEQTGVSKAISLSLFTSAVTTLVTILIGSPVAVLLAHSRSGLRTFVDTVIDLPTVLPPSVAGVALLLTFGRRGILGQYFAVAGIQLPFTTAAVIMAQTFVAAPFFIKAAMIGFSAIEPELKHAAALDGASRWQTFRYVDLPLSWRALVSGGVMTWARAIGEFGATILFAGNFQGRTQTMPLAIYVGFETDVDVAVTLSIILIAFAFVTLWVVKAALYRRVGHSVEEISID